MSDKIISQYVEDMFPSFYKEEGPLFIQFTKAYYEWLEQQDNVQYHINKLPDDFDIDKTIDEFITHFRQQYLPNLDFSSETDKRAILKHAREFLATKGTEENVQLLMQLVYNQTATVFRPNDKVLRPSDGVWYEPKYLELSPSPRTAEFLGRNIVGSISGASALAERLVRKTVGGMTFDVLYISQVKGNFLYKEIITSDGLLDDCPKIIGSLTTIDLTSGGKDFSIGDVVAVQSELTGRSGLARVSSVGTATGRVTFDVQSGGYGFTNDAIVYVSDKVVNLSAKTSNPTSNSTNGRYFDFVLLEQVVQPMQTISLINAPQALAVNTFVRGYAANGLNIANGYVIGVPSGFSSNNQTVKVIVQKGSFAAAANVATAGNTYVSIVDTVTNTHATGILVGTSNTSTIAGTVGSIGVAAITGSFTGNTPYAFVYGRTSNTYANVYSLSSGSGASFDVGLLTTTEEVFINTDRLAANNVYNQPFMSVKLINNGFIEDVRITNKTPNTTHLYASGGGTLYTEGDQQTLTFTNGGTPTALASGVIIVANGVVSTITVSSPADRGSGYTNNQAIAFNGNTRTVSALLSTARSAASITSGNTLGLYVGLAVTGTNIPSNTFVSAIDPEAGVLYLTNAPTVDNITTTLSFPAAGYVSTNSSGAITSLTLTSQGSGYTSAPTISIGGGIGANLTVSIANGVVVDTRIDSIGANYASSVVVSASTSGVAATLAAVIDSGYGFIKDPNADLDTILANALTSGNYTIGSIAGITNISIGSSYNQDPFVLVMEPVTVGFNRRDISIQHDNPQNSFLIGELITQNFSSTRSLITYTNKGAADFIPGELVVQGNNEVIVSGTIETNSSITVTLPGAYTLPYTGTLTDAQKNQLFVVSPSTTVYSTWGTRTGTVSGNSTSPVVNGSSTSFLTQYQVGDYIAIANSSGGFSHTRQILSIANNISLTLTDNAIQTGSFSGVNHTRSFPANIPIPTNSRSTALGNVVAVASNTTTLTVTLGETLQSTTSANVQLNITNSSPRASILKLEETSSTTGAIELIDDVGTFAANTTLLVGLTSGATANIASVGTTSTIQAVRGRVKSVSNGYIGVERLSFNLSFTPGVSIVGSQTGATANVVNVTIDNASKPIGFNAEINADAGTVAGFIKAIDIVDSGFAYKDLEPVELRSSNNIYVATGYARLKNQGQGEGYFLSERGFLNDSWNYLHDNDYWQEYSYEVRTGISLKKYGEVLKQTCHVAGTKLFGSIDKVSENKEVISATGLIGTGDTLLFLANGAVNTITSGELLTINGSTIGFANGSVYGEFQTTGYVDVAGSTVAYTPNVAVANASIIVRTRNYTGTSGNSSFITGDTVGGKLLPSGANTIEMYTNTFIVSVSNSANFPQGSVAIQISNTVANSILAGPSPYVANTRSTVATYRTANGRLATAAVNTVRPKYNSSNTFVGLLIEPSRTNLLANSSDLTVAGGWTLANVSVVSNDLFDLFSVQAADKILADVVSGVHEVKRNSITVANGQLYTLSCFFRAAEYSYAALTLPASRFGSDQTIIVNLSTGATYNYEGSATPTVERYADGWVRLGISATSTSSGTGTFYIRLAANSSAISFTPALSSQGVHAFGAQLEAGVLTSYIPTPTLTTRAADSLSLTATGWAYSNSGAGVVSNTHTGSIAVTPLTKIDVKLAANNGPAPRGYTLVQGNSTSVYASGNIVFSNNTSMIVTTNIGPFSKSYGSARVANGYVLNVASNSSSNALLLQVGEVVTQSNGTVTVQGTVYSKNSSHVVVMSANGPFTVSTNNTVKRIIGVTSGANVFVTIANTINIPLSNVSRTSTFSNGGYIISSGVGSDVVSNTVHNSISLTDTVIVPMSNAINKLSISEYVGANVGSTIRGVTSNTTAIITSIER